MNINEILRFWLKIEKKKRILFSERCKMLKEMNSCGFDITRP